MSNDQRIARRDFLKTSAAGAAAVGMGVFGAPAPASALGANDRIRFAVIGVGGMGGGHVGQLIDMSKNPDLNIALTAVCDVFDNRANHHANRCGGTAYRDYRQLIEKADVDAVVIATPDHWHAKISIDCLEAGLHVYCQKPMTLHWEEAKEVYQCVERTKMAFQVGAQGCSDDVWWKAQEQIRAGALGKLVWSQTGAFRNVPRGDWNYGLDWGADPTKNLDWDLWLGSAPKRPFELDRFCNFRKYWDYSGGLATDLLYHALSHMIVALGPQFPTRVVASGTNCAVSDREVPDNFHVCVDYPAEENAPKTFEPGKKTLTAERDGKQVPISEYVLDSTPGHTMAMHATGANDNGIPEIIRGEEATMTFEGPGLVIRPQGPYKEKRPEVSVAREPRSDHMVNFINAIRGTEKCHLDALTGYKCQVAIDLGCRSYRERKVMLFDPVKQELIG
jgi:predicted dehydrogenase